MKNFVTGAQLYSVRRLVQTAEGMDETFARLKAMGYNTLQLSGQNRQIPDGAVADLLKKHGLKCVVTHNSMRDFEEDLPATVARHKAWDCVYAGLGALPEEYRGGVDGYRAFSAKVNAIAEKLADEGITFVYHNHCFEFERFGGVSGMDVMFDCFSDKAQFEPDTYWMQAGGANPVEWLRKLNGRAEVVHFKDMAGCGENRPNMVPVGEGNLDWNAIRAVCESTGVKFAEVEQDNADDTPDPLGQMEISARNLKKMGFAL